jgi:hypothetical protein
MVNNSLPKQTTKTNPMPTKTVVDGGVLGSISNIGDVLGKFANSITPALDTYFNFTLAKEKIKLESALNMDGSVSGDDSPSVFEGGFSNSNNQTLLIIAGLAAVAVGLIIFFKK